MDPGRLEEIPLPFEQALSSLEQRVMTEIVRAIRINGFSTSTADWQTEKPLPVVPIHIRPLLSQKILRISLLRIFPLSKL